MIIYAYIMQVYNCMFPELYASTMNVHFLICSLFLWRTKLWGMFFSAGVKKNLLAHIRIWKFVSLLRKNSNLRKVAYSISKPLFPPSRLSVHPVSVWRHTSAFHPINSSRCLNSLIKVAPYVLGVDPWGPGCSRT